MYMAIEESGRDFVVRELKECRYFAEKVIDRLSSLVDDCAFQDLSIRDRISRIVGKFELLCDSVDDVAFDV